MFETRQGAIKPIVYMGILQRKKLLMVKYKEAPNPSKNGWWIPAPGLEFGEDPAERAARVLEEFGFGPSPISLHSVESFVLSGGWHLIYHYVCEVNGEPRSNSKINQYKWVSLQELRAMTDVAHGKWEIGVGSTYLRSL